jgi:nucleoporin NUP42
VNDPYYPTGKMESGNTSAFGGGTNTFGGGTGTLGGTAGGAFGQPSVSSTLTEAGGTSSFGKTPSFGSSPFGSMPASAFSLGSRFQASADSPSAFGNTTTTPSSFGQPTSTSAFGQPKSVFGTTTTPSAFGTTTTQSAFGAKPSAFGGGTSLPAAPLSSSLSSSTPSFGQPSVLGAGSLPPPPTIGMASGPTFGQTSGLGVLGASSSAAFGQASSFSSPFAGGLGKALGGGMTGSTFGSKSSSFGGFAQGNQPNAFAAAAAATSQPNAFMQAASPSSQPSVFQAPSGFGDANRFASLGEIRGNDRDDDMEDDDVQTVVMEQSAPPTQASTPTTGTTTLFTQSLPTVPETQSASDAFGGSGVRATGEGLGPAPAVSAPGSTPVATSVQPAPTGVNPQKPISVASLVLPVPATTSSAQKKPVIDEMAVWRADKFEIGMIPETEPPLDVR